MATSSATANTPITSLKQFLESTPPEVQAEISDLTWEQRMVGGGVNYLLSKPELLLNCSSEICHGDRIYRCTSSDYYPSENWGYHYMTYKCSNCQQNIKVYSLATKKKGGFEVTGSAYKFGELPIFGPTTPAKLITLIGPDRDFFLRGRRSENRGLGIGAFAYYRRVVEDQKSRIFGEIIKVAKKLDAAPTHITELEAAAKETQFSKAVDQIKSGIPAVLLIEGNNPLTLLHSALSEGIHAKTDEECLDIAHSIRIVLAELAERMGQILKEESELKDAVRNLLKRKTT